MCFPRRAARRRRHVNGIVFDRVCSFVRSSVAKNSAIYDFGAHSHARTYTQYILCAVREFKPYTRWPHVSLYTPFAATTPQLFFSLSVHTKLFRLVVYVQSATTFPTCAASTAAVVAVSVWRRLPRAANGWRDREKTVLQAAHNTIESLHCVCCRRLSQLNIHRVVCTKSQRLCGSHDDGARRQPTKTHAIHITNTQVTLTQQIDCRCYCAATDAAE